MKTEKTKSEKIVLEGIVGKKVEYKPKRTARKKKIDENRAREIVKRAAEAVLNEKSAIEIETMDFLKAINSGGTKGSTANSIVRKILKDLRITGVGVHVDDEKIIFYPR